MHLRFDPHGVRAVDGTLARVAPFALLALLLSCSPDEPGSSQGSALIELRLAQDAPRTGWSSEHHEGQVLYVAPDIVLSDTDLVRVIPAAGNDRLVLDLQIDSVAAERLSRFASEHVGTRIAVYVEGQLREAPRVRTGDLHTDGRIQIGLRAPGGEAVRLAEEITRRWPGDPRGGGD